MLAVLRDAIATDATRLREHEPAVREGNDPEAVHQARVACRRLRSELRTFSGALRAGEVADLVEELAWLGRLLGSVRDLDVLAERLAEDCREADEEAARSVVRRCVMDRQEAFADAIVGMRSKRYRRLVRYLDEAAADPPLRKSCADLPAATVLVPEVRRRFGDLDAGVRALPAVARDDQLHHVRILSKRARYAAEIAAPVGPAELGRLAKRLAKVQTVLGDLNDASRAVAWLEHLKVSPWPEGTLPPGRDPIVAVELALASEHQLLAAQRERWRQPVESARQSASALGWASPPASDGDRLLQPLPVRP